ncbi:50S ribosomal protein L24 [Clostridia bacterium]|nr:50S ribosomal protein L24 [Clostridia bacterium]
MSIKRIKTGDLVKVISGSNKGKIGKVVSVLPKENKATIEGLGLVTRHIKPSQLNPKGGKKDIHVGIDLSKLKLVIDEKAGTTSRIGYIKKEGKTVRIAKQANNKEVK